MLVPQSVERRWGLEKQEKLILVPLKTNRSYEIIKNIALCALCLFSFGVALYFNPSLHDQIYYALFHHRKLVKLQKDPFGLVSLMNFGKLKKTMQELGWSEKTDYLSRLVLKKRSKKISVEDRMKKMLQLFFLSIRQIHEIKPAQKVIGFCPEMTSLSSRLQDISYSYCLSPGIKTLMEDLVHIDSINIQVKGAEEAVSAFILMDGHGVQKGQEPINIFTKKYFLHHLRTYLNAYLREGFTLSGVYEAFKSSFIEINENFPHQRSGTTFLGIFVINHMLFCVSIGDSKAFLIDPFLNLPIALTADPNHPYFLKRLEKNGAKVMTCNQVTRVEGLLNMSSALGDKHITNASGQKVIKPIMSFVALPKIWIQNPAFIILGSDGVFDYVKPEELETIIRCDTDIKEKAESLMQFAYNQGSKDNLSTIILKI